MYLFSFLFDSFHFIVEESPPSPAIVTRKQGALFRGFPAFLLFCQFGASFSSFFFYRFV